MKIEVDQIKYCPMCNSTKSEDEFSNDKANKDGKRSHCKACDKEKKKLYRLRNREKDRARCRKYNRERSLEISDYHKAYRAGHYEELVSKGFVYRAGRKELISSQSKEQRRTNPEIHMFRGAKRRAKKLGVPFAIEKSDIVVPCTCPVLGIPLTIGDGVLHDGSPTLDRLIPELGYVPENIAVISNRANRMKDDGTAEEHRLLADWIEGKSSVVSNFRPAERKHAGILLTCAKNRALKEGVSFTIQQEDILIPDVCPAIGIPISRGKGKMHGGSPTLDKK